MSGGEPTDVFQLAGTTLEGRFVVERVVAEGGFGVVYRAQQAALERPIALKVLKTPERFDEAAKKHFLASFAAEAKTIARIAHPNIVNVFDFGVSEVPSGGRAAWMALEWLTGVTLEEELLRRRGRGGRTPAECLALITPILSALAIVHTEGVAHRDLKPANIMLVPTQAGSVLKLLDFGIAKIMEADEAPGTGHTRTRSNQVAFSPGYAAPEQISNGRTGPWTDVHAMGLILSEMLTDQSPFEAEEMGLLFQQIVDRTRPTPSKRGFDVGAWEAVLARALAVSSAERYRDAGELLRALEAVIPQASSPRVSNPDAVRGALGLPPVSLSASTLEAMSTQMAAPAGAATPVRSNATTSTPTSDEGPRVEEARPSRAPLYVGGVALAVVAFAGIGWLAMALASETHAVGIVHSVTAAQTPPSASAPEAVPLSSAASASAPVQPSASAPEPLPPPPASTAREPAPPVATPPSARPSQPTKAPGRSVPSAAHSAPPAKPALPTQDTMR